MASFLWRSISRRFMCSDVIARYGKTPLFVVGDKLTQVESVVVPDIDIKERCVGEDIVKNLTARRLTPKLDLLNHLRNGADYLTWIDRERVRLEAEQEGIRGTLQSLVDREKGGVSLSDAEKETLEQLKANVRESRKNLKDLARSRWELEDSVILPFLDLPNVLHENCPLEKDFEVFSAGCKPEFDFAPKCHLKVAAGEIETFLVSHTSYYLTGRLAKMELELTRRAQAQLLDRNFSIVSCPDFCKSLILEGCGTDFSEPDREFCLTEAQEFKSRETGQAMHLVGGASLYPFVALFCKNIVVQPKLLPQSFFSIGRRYRPQPLEFVDLFTTQQSTAVELFHVTAFGAERDFDALLEVVKDFYASLDVHFRLIVRAARTLSVAESYRVSIELWSPARDDYVEVGHLSMYGDYLSKRMMLKSEDRDDLLNLVVIAGQLVDVTKLLACFIECRQNSFGQWT